VKEQRRCDMKTFYISITIISILAFASMAYADDYYRGRGSSISAGYYGSPVFKEHSGYGSGIKIYIGGYSRHYKGYGKYYYGRRFRGYDRYYYDGYSYGKHRPYKYLRHRPYGYGYGFKHKYYRGSHFPRHRGYGRW
jgi:hypothetical protein